MTASTLVRSHSTLADRLLVEVRDNLPVWFVVWLSIGHTYAALAFLEPSRVSALATLLFPISWTTTYYYERCRKMQVDGAVIVALCLTAPAIALLLWSPLLLAWNPADPTRLRLAYELLSIAWTIVLLLHCLRNRGWHGVVIFFVAAGLYGLLLETTGISLGYFGESGYHLYVPWTQTPVLAVAGWCTIFYPSVFIAESLAERIPTTARSMLPMALLVAMIALSSDVHFDPLATALGLWTWNDRLPAAFLGVPLVNFTSWLSAVFAFAAMYHYVMRRSWSMTAKAGSVVLAVPLMQGLAGLLNLALIGILEGLSGPSLSILRDSLAR